MLRWLRLEPSLLSLRKIFKTNFNEVNNALWPQTRALSD
jgi:hypothetical protein